MVPPLHPFTPSRPGGHGGVERRSPAQLCRFAGVLLTRVPEGRQEADRPRQGVLAAATAHPQRGLAQGAPPRRPLLVDLPARGCFLRLLDALGPGPLPRPVARTPGGPRDARGPPLPPGRPGGGASQRTRPHGGATRPRGRWAGHGGPARGACPATRRRDTTETGRAASPAAVAWANAAGER